MGLRSPRRVELHAYETDTDLLPLLLDALTACQASLGRQGHQLDFTIEPKDFITVGPDAGEPGELFGPVEEQWFDAAIMNPPYLKIGARSEYGRAMRHIVHGQPNLYALFMSKAAHVLAPCGQLVAITPRSFCNGPYFRHFRRWFLSRMNLRRVHLFESRTDAFSEAKVLQENIITYARRDTSQSGEIRLSHSRGKHLSRDLTELRLPASLVIDDSSDDAIVRLPTSEMGVAIMRAVEAWPERFSSHGLRVSTGPVVLFRSRRFISEREAGPGEIPLLSVQNVRPFRTVWPGNGVKKTVTFHVTPESRKLLIPRGNYVLLRRFSAKEDRRRLTASCLLADEIATPHVAIENHLNYICHDSRALTRYETIGVAMLLNSRLLDTYFRTISGNTQVNAAEVRKMPFPGLDAVAKLGRIATTVNLDDAVAVEEAVLNVLRIDGAIREFLVE